MDPANDVVDTNSDGGGIKPGLGIDDELIVLHVSAVDELVEL